MMTLRRPMKFFLRLVLVQLLLATSVWAAGFSAHYVARSRQLWFIQPLAEKDSYRVCITVFDANGAPQREITANQATYARGIWSFHDGWEIILDPDTFALKDVNPLQGPHPEFALNPASAPATDPRIAPIGRATLFAEKSSPPNYVNLSLFKPDPAFGIVTYLFARRATLVVGNDNVSGRLSQVLTVVISPDSNVPTIAIAPEYQF